jgi:hypothetical protein
MTWIAPIARIKFPDDSPWLAGSDFGHIRGLASTARKADWASLVRFLSGSSGIARLGSDHDDIAVPIDEHTPDLDACL